MFKSEGLLRYEPGKSGKRARGLDNSDLKDDNSFVFKRNESNFSRPLSRERSLGLIDNQVRNVNFFRTISGWKDRDYSLGAFRFNKASDSKVSTPGKSVKTPSKTSNGNNLNSRAYLTHDTKDYGHYRAPPTRTDLGSLQTFSKLNKTRNDISRKLDQIPKNHSYASIRASRPTSSLDARGFDSLFDTINERSRVLDRRDSTKESSIQRRLNAKVNFSSNNSFSKNDSRHQTLHLTQVSAKKSSMPVHASSKAGGSLMLSPTFFKKMPQKVSPARKALGSKGIIKNENVRGTLHEVQRSLLELNGSLGRHKFKY